MLSTRNLKAGDVLDGRYRLERRIGGGGMGDVWEGTDTILWRTVAVKILLADLVDDRGFRERFRREARAIAVMKGPGVVDVYDYGEIEHDDAQIAYLIMEYVDGKPLSRLLGLWGKLGSADTLRVVGGVAEALHVAHSAGIVHRDIKPGNILVRGDGSVVLVDFGIARVSHNLTLTTTGVVLGTVTYMSPEQAAGENLTPASDLYSLGVVAHQCLAGAPPFRADTPLGVLSAHLRNAPPPLPTGVPYEVTEIVRRSLQKDPSARWPDASALAAACNDTRAALVGTRAPAAPMRTRVQPGPRPSPVHTGAHRRPEPGTGSHTGAHAQSTGPHTGSAPATGHTGPTRPAPVQAPVEERPRRRGLWLSLAGTLAGLAAVAAIITTLPWNDEDDPNTLPSSKTAASDAELQGQDGDEGEPGSGEEWPDTATAPADAEESATDAATSDVTADPEGTATPSYGPSSSPSASPSSSPSPEAKVTVPNLVNQSEADARQRIEESGLHPSVVYDGEGEARCGVVRQYPSAGTEVAADSTVQVTVKRAANAEACKTESDQTEAPDGQ